MTDINIYIQLIFIFLFMTSMGMALLFFNNDLHMVLRYSWYTFMGNFKFMFIMLFYFLNMLNMFVIYNLYFKLSMFDMGYLFLGLEYQLYLYLLFYSTLFSISELSYMFILLISFLYPFMLMLMQYDFQVYQYKYFIYMIWLYLIMYMFIFTADMFVFYMFYEFMVGLVFYIMYLTANSRGSIEAILFFLGWAIIGSFCLGIAIMYIIINSGQYMFDNCLYMNFSSNERYFLYWLMFFGFGTKLAMWPFWYWLPSAHVEVSTGMSIFLSCMLMKMCFYGFVSLYISVVGEAFLLPFVFFAGMCIFDLTVSLLIQMDLKAITAYGSVLHINLFIILFLVDTNMINNGIMFYMWGHSYATAGVFFMMNLFERCNGSRLTFELSGIYNTNPLVGLMGLFTIITFLEFPLSFFFWGELWLWLVFLDFFPLFTILIMFISVFCYIIIFFSLWWTIIFGSSKFISSIPAKNIFIEDMFLMVYIIFFQYLIGLVPNLLCWYTMN